MKGKKIVSFCTFFILLMLLITGCGSDVQENKIDSETESETAVLSADESDYEKQEENTEKTIEPLAAPVIGEWTNDESEIHEEYGAAGINVSWSEVEGAKGYEYKFYFVWGGHSDPLESGETTETNASCFFQDIAEYVRVEVRAVGEVNGQTVCSDWAAGEIEGEDIEKITIGEAGSSSGE